jgi:putative MATE family efflux protein
MNRTDLLGSGSIKSLFFRLTIPAVVAQVISLLYNIVDRIYIGHMAEVGQSALTGAGLFVPILLLINAFAMLVASGGAPLMSIRLGEGQKEKAEKIMGNSFSALILLSIVLTIVMYLAAPQLLYFFGASENTFVYALPYARIYILGTVFVTIALGMNFYISAQGFAKESMMTNIIGAVINIILDPILIFGFNMGVEGAAIATVFSQAVSAAWVIIFLMGTRPSVRLQKKTFRIEKKILMPCLALGASSFIMLSTESLLSITFNHSLALYGGDMAVGAMTIITSVSSLISMPLNGITQGAAPLLSYNFGAAKNDRVRKSFRMIFTTCVVYAGIGWILIMLLPRTIASAFTANTELLDYSVWAMRIYFACTITLGFQISCQQSFVALGQAKISLLMALLRKIVLLIPLILILPHFISNQVLAVFIAEPISDAIAASITTIMFFTRVEGILAKGPQNRQIEA